MLEFQKCAESARRFHASARGFHVGLLSGAVTPRKCRNWLSTPMPQHVHLCWSMGPLKLSEVVQVRLLMVRAESFEAACEEGVLAMQAGRFQRLLLDVVLPGLLFIEDCLMLHDTPDVEREAGRQGSRATAALCRPILYGATRSHFEPPANHKPTNCFPC